MMHTFKTPDPITQAFNNPAFLMEIETEVCFSCPRGTPLALLMLDLDHFKKVNDTYGHAAGDLVIRAVAQRVMQSMRKEDIFARYGGEEFALLLRSTAIEGAFIVAERLRRGIEELEVTHTGRRIPCTVSVGVALLDENITRPTELIEAADERLYQAKRKGRNRTESALFD